MTRRSLAALLVAPPLTLAAWSVPPPAGGSASAVLHALPWALAAAVNLAGWRLRRGRAVVAATAVAVVAPGLAGLA
ncbi:MAG: hypothetical protein D6738_05560, partial [Acidobacteria bacterium]